MKAMMAMVAKSLRMVDEDRELKVHREEERRSLESHERSKSLAGSIW